MDFQNSAAVCRQREAHHRQMAEEATLPNVRRVALTAAAAWAVQAEEAEEHESGVKAALSDEDAAIALEFQLEEDFADSAEAPETGGKFDPASKNTIAPNDRDQ
jgi:hypothetical protein